MAEPDWLRLNRGRWGADDRRGALNYITPGVTQAATRLVRRGVTYDLGTQAGATAPRTAARLPPFVPPGAGVELRDGPSATTT